MLRSIGPHPRGDAGGDSLAGLLAACHERIRRFSAMATALAASPTAAAPADVADTARAIRRYFAEALPLHLADEEESLLPRLRGHDPALDAALARMHAEHRDHQPLVDAVIAACDAIAAGAAAPATLAAPAAALAAATESHLAAEEATIAPAVAALPADVQATIVTELRARRA